MAGLKLELPAPAGGRLPWLDELKGLAICLIVLYHAGGVLGWENKLHGELGVDIFVILSGVGLALSTRREKTGTFLRRRLMRIFPTYWLVLTFFWALNAHFLQKSYSAPNIISHYLGLHGWLGDGYALAIVDSFWFITLILSLYLIYCFVRKWDDEPNRSLLAGAVISCAVASVIFFFRQPVMFSHIGLRFPDFFIGLLIGRLLKHGGFVFELDGILAVGILIFTYVPFVEGIIFFPQPIALALMGAYLFGWRKYVPAQSKASSARVLKFLGDHSLEIFLIHQPLIRDYNFYLHGRWLGMTPTPLSLIVGMAAGFTVTLLLSVELKSLVAKFVLNEKKPA